jgi:hypothetical protein
MNTSNSSLNGYVFWSLQTPSKDDLIYLFACLPISVLGCFFCLASVYVLRSSEFKENLFIYLRLECMLMALDLFITSIRSVSPVFMCRTSKSVCPVPTSSFPVIVDVVMFLYIPSPTEATALVTDIFAALNCLIMIHPNRNKLEQFIFNMNPFVTIGVAYFLLALMFIYQCFTNVYLIHSNFVISNRIYFDLIAFSIRDGLFLFILIILNVIIAWKVKSSLRKKMNIVREATSIEKTKRSQHRMTIMVLADCINLALGRIPIFCLFVIRNVNKPISVIYPLSSTLSLAVFLSYFLKFFIYFKFNKRFRLVAYQKFPFLLKLFCNNTEISEQRAVKTNEKSNTTNRT